MGTDDRQQREEPVGRPSLWSFLCTFTFFPESGRGQTPEGRRLPPQEARRRGRSISFLRVLSLT